MSKTSFSWPFFTAGGASLKINDTLPAAKIRANEALQDLTSVCPILQCRTTWQCGISTVVVLSRVFVTQTSKLFLEACISPACKNFLEIGKKKRLICVQLEAILVIHVCAILFSKFVPRLRENGNPKPTPFRTMFRGLWHYQRSGWVQA